MIFLIFFILGIIYKGKYKYNIYLFFVLKVCYCVWIVNIRYLVFIDYMILIKFGVLWIMYCLNVIIIYYNIFDICLWIYNYFIENFVRKYLYCIWLKYFVWFDYN